MGRALRIASYVGYFLLMLLVGFYLTFPWDAAKDKLLGIANKQLKMNITAESLEPNWLTGVIAKNVSVTPATGEAIKFERIDARAKVLAFLTGKTGFDVSLPLAKGTVVADVVLDEETNRIKSKLEKVELGLVPRLVEAIGVPLTGTVDLDVDLLLGKKDPKLTVGNILLKAKGLQIEKGGKISGFPVPELAIGDADWKIPVEGGKATLKNLKVSGDSFDVNLDGTVSLLDPISRSTPNLTVSFKPTEKFLQAEPLIGALLNNLQRAKGSDGFYTYAMSGTFQNPRFMPRKK